ncbi:MAG: CBASS oligonucleotide cyclase [Methanothrix sp.]|uniref:CBASS oligonucleotide cyclase n=1 Tax=Methanothrix sp. TaxID=90426 RepID=UPI003BB75883
MGASGGNFNISSEEYKKYDKEIKEKTRDELFDTEVAEIIGDILAEYNNRDNEAIERHLEKIKNLLEDEFGGVIDLRFGGSVKKHTYVDGLSDIDVLVLVNKCDLSNMSPREALEAVKRKIIEMRFNDIKNIEARTLSVTLTFSDDKVIQLLPAIKSGNGYKIATEKGDRWSNVIRPDKFAERLTEINQFMGGKVIPVIKLVKGINSQLPKSQQLKGYHIESMAIEAFKTYPDDAVKTPKVMLKYFFEKAKDIIRKPIQDRTKQSLNVDDDLGPENSNMRSSISATLDIIFRRMKDADETGDVSRWKDILGA